MTMKRTAMAFRNYLLVSVAVCSWISTCNAGPLPTNSSLEIGKSGSCSVGDVVYLPGDEFPGAGPCERCRCADGGVSCNKQTCQARPGCKAVHRPDSCCPTYQCDCEQEGRVYGNGEKLVDPQDPCRVCYCQGGEVVCRRIACFVRDDCRPRLVPGRCCPEYDNCPLRGVTSAPGAVPSESSLSSYEKVSVSSAEPASSEKPKSEITIKEITPVSEIPAISGVKIKEILPSPSIEIIEYPPSSKSPLIPREAVTDKPSGEEIESVDYSPSLESSQTSGSPISAQELSTKPSSEVFDTKTTAESVPSKISLSTQGFVSSETYSSNIPSSVPASGSSEGTSTKAPVVEEEDQTFFEVNPAFPPLPDDLSVLSNHGDEIIPESHIDNEHISSGQETVVASEATSTEATTTTTAAPTSTSPAPLTETTIFETTQSKLETTTDSKANRNTEISTTEAVVLKNSPMLNLRTAIPTELLNEPLTESEVINGQLDEISDTTTDDAVPRLDNDIPTTLLTTKIPEIEAVESFIDEVRTESPAVELITTTSDAGIKIIDTTPDTTTFVVPEEQSSTRLPNTVTENAGQTEISSLPIETSNQNPPITPESEVKTSTAESLTSPTSIKILPTEAEPITVGRTSTSKSVETTSFSLSPISSAETSTDAVELINVSSGPSKNAAIISSQTIRNSNSLTDLINLVGDVASMSDQEHTDAPATVKLETTSISSSEELLPVNSASYKSKNKNWNVNSITEIPLKTRPTTNKERVVEIDDDEATITDLPHDKNEPTTQRPIIDNVTAGPIPKNNTDSKDIEIISNSYVPSISRRPTKVVMKKNSGQTSAEDGKSEAGPSAEVSTDEAKTEAVTLSPEVTSSVNILRTTDQTQESTSTPQQ